ncbi:MAG: HAD family hydrolase [Thermoplasmata archaeon]
MARAYQLEPVGWVLFDVEGTLLESRDPLRWAAWADEAGLPTDPEAIAHFHDDTWIASDAGEVPPGAEEFWRRVFRDAGTHPLDPARLRRFVELLQIGPPRPQAFSDVGWCLAEIGRRGIQVGVASIEGSEEMVRFLLKAAGLDGRFRFIEAPLPGETPSSAGPALLARAVGRTGTSPMRSVYVGARPHRGVRTARSVGIPAVWLHRQGTGFEGELPEITSLSELPGALERGVRLK